ncbi:MAG TPA: hypothetical protein VFM49_13120 [Chloroflexia bacterium]|jgi:hypothetical protein|nr:hypothetical protein [Chloroflexia bacterium]
MDSNHAEQDPVTEGTRRVPAGMPGAIYTGGGTVLPEDLELDETYPPVANDLGDAFNADDRVAPGTDQETGPADDTGSTGGSYSGGGSTQGGTGYLRGSDYGGSGKAEGTNTSPGAYGSGGSNDV